MQEMEFAFGERFTLTLPDGATVTVHVDADPCALPGSPNRDPRVRLGIQAPRHVLVDRAERLRRRAG